jgi:hypothetical protein
MFEAKHARERGDIERARILRDAATKVLERELVGEGFKVAEGRAYFRALPTVNA